MIKDIAKYLDYRGVGVFDEEGKDGNIYIASMPQSPDGCISIYPGSPRQQNPKHSYDIINCQIIIRGDHKTPLNTTKKAEEIYNILHGFSCRRMLESPYIINIICNNAVPIGRDESHRYEFSLNFSIEYVNEETQNREGLPIREEIPIFGSITIKALDSQGNLLQEYTKYNLILNRTYEIESPTLENYNLQEGEHKTKEVYVSYEESHAEAIFNYEQAAGVIIVEHFYNGEVFEAYAKENLAYGTYIIEFEDYLKYQLIEGEEENKTIEITEEELYQTVTFNYEDKKGIITIKSINQSEEVFHTETLEDLEIEAHTVEAPEHEAYKFKKDQEEQKEVTLSYEEHEKEVIFEYKENGDITINHVDENNEIIKKEELKGLSFGVHVVEAEDFEDYELTSEEDGEEVEVTAENYSHEITFIYEEIRGEITITHKDTDNNIIETEVLDDLDIATHTLQPKDYEEYYDGQPEIKEVTLTYEEYEKEITFIYEEIKGEITINHKDTDNNIIETETLEDLEIATHTIESKDFEEYHDGQPEIKEVTLTYENYEKEITFNYEKIKGKITIESKDDEGVIIETETLEDLDIKTHTIQAPEHEGYELGSGEPEQKEVTLTYENYEKEITFVYEEDLEPEDLEPVEEWSFEGHIANINALAIDSLGYIYSGSNDETVKKINPDTGDEVWSFEDRFSINALAVDSQDYIYSGSNNNKVKKINPDTGNEEWSFEEHNGSIYSIAIDSQGYIYSGDWDNKVKKINPDTGNEEWSFEEHNGNIYSIAIDSQDYIYSGSVDNTVKKINPDTGNEVWSFEEHSGGVWDIAVDSQGYIYSGSGDNTLKKINPDTGNEVWSFEEHNGTIRSIAIDSQGYIYSGSGDNTLKKINPDTGNEVWSFEEHTDSVRALAVDSQDYIYSGSNDDKVKKTNPDTGNEEWSFEEHTDSVRALAVDSQDYIYSGSWDETVKKIKQVPAE